MASLARDTCDVSSRGVVNATLSVSIFPLPGLFDLGNRLNEARSRLCVRPSPIH